MKREPLPSIEQVAEIIRGVDLTSLSNRLAGKQLLAMEHCLIEVLGALSESHASFKAIVLDLAEGCAEAQDEGSFLTAYNDYQREKSSWSAKYVNYSPVGRYFQALLDKLNGAEEKQDLAGKPVTVSHARILAVLIVRQLATMSASGQYRNDRIEKLWEHWINRKPATA